MSVTERFCDLPLLASIQLTKPYDVVDAWIDASHLQERVFLVSEEKPAISMLYFDCPCRQQTTERKFISYSYGDI